jgi:hypothetical protein
MSKTTHDEISIDLDGTIDSAIKKLQKLKKDYPKGRISLENEYEYGESYARLKLHFTRDKEPVELELEGWREKLNRYAALCSAASAYAANGDKYPRETELADLKKELGCWADDHWGGSLTIVDGEVLMYGFHGAQTRDGTWRLKTFSHPDMRAAMDARLEALSGKIEA